MRKIIRKLIPFHLYRLISYLYTLAWSLSEGPRLTCFMLRGTGEVTWSFRRLLHPFTFRLIKPDRGVVLQNIIRGECVGGPMPCKADFIVDGGGYIGDSASVFLSLYSSAQCYVFEPSSNVELARRNLCAYGDRAVLTKAFLGRSQGSLAINEADVGSCGRPAAVNDEVIPVWTLDEVLMRSPTGRINILKLDVEGAEVEILRPPTPWLSRVDCIIVELHDEDGYKNIPVWLAEAGFTVKQCRGLFFCNRQVDVNADLD